PSTALRSDHAAPVGRPPQAGAARPAGLSPVMPMATYPVMPMAPYPVMPMAAYPTLRASAIRLQLDASRIREANEEGALRTRPLMAPVGIGGGETRHRHRAAEGG